MTLKLVHYCCGKFPDSFGGVARFDYHVSLAFPDRAWFLGVAESQGINQKDKMLAYLEQHKGNVVVVTDNHLACDVPNDYPLIIVHHGCVKTTIDRTPALANNQVYKDLLAGQDKMLEHRSPKNTMILSCSKDCIDSFTINYGKKYTNFPIHLLWHSSELPVYIRAPRATKKPRVLGNFNNAKKGISLINKLTETLKSEFEFVNLKTKINKNIDQHNKEVAEIYKSCDIFLQLSTSEGNSYATLDGFVHDMLICGTNTGLLYDLQHADVGVIFDWTKMTDTEYVANRLRELWKNRDKYYGKSRSWFEQNAQFDGWKNSFKNIVTKFYAQSKV